MICLEKEKMGITVLQIFENLLHGIDTTRGRNWGVEGRQNLTP